MCQDGAVTSLRNSQDKLFICSLLVEIKIYCQVLFITVTKRDLPLCTETSQTLFCMFSYHIFKLFTIMHA